MELVRDGVSVSPANYVDTLIEEIQLAAHEFSPRPLHSVFFGGGTPTMLPASDLVRVLGALRDVYGLAVGAEVTTEANPDSVTREYLAQLHVGGFTRISFGHQSSSTTVLQILERTHTPGKTWDAVRWANDVGFEHISVDLIYGTPGETDEDIAQVMREIADVPVDHVSAYSLIVEPGTRMARKVERGEIEKPSDDVAAHRYELIDNALQEMGFTWYEISNWSRQGGECQHNVAYWRNQDWLAFGPGAHGHIDGQRMWNVKHPAAWAANVQSGQTTPEREQLDADDRRHESIMLGLRLREGLPLNVLTEKSRAEATQIVGEGLATIQEDRLVLTDEGRLLADGLVSRLWD